MNKENLLVLADFLETKVKPKNFSMAVYFDKPNFYDGFYTEFKAVTKKTYSCGTVACAVGHGPAAGFKKREDEAWSDYGERIFGIPAAFKEWRYLFSADWADIDNTPEGAAKRIRKFVKTGEVPKKWLRENGYVS